MKYKNYIVYSYLLCESVSESVGLYNIIVASWKCTVKHRTIIVRTNRTRTIISAIDHSNAQFNEIVGSMMGTRHIPKLFKLM